MNDIATLTPEAVQQVLNKQLVDLSTEIHADNVAAGWWSDLHTGESILVTRNRPEIMMLIVSEIAEASDGANDGLMDDKLPHLRMFDVELADTAIRCFDVLGADGVSEFPVIALDEFTELFFTQSIDQCLMHLVSDVAGAMEHYRKGRTPDYVFMLAHALIGVFGLAKSRHIDLFDIIHQKRAFNRSRADHKPENRLKDDGKKF